MNANTIRPNPEPHNIEAEQNVIGTILLNNAALDKTAGIIDQASFYDPFHADLFQRMKLRIDAGQLVSPVTMKVELQDSESLKSLGGPAYLVRMAAAAISTHAIVDYARLLADLKAKRDLLALMQIGTDKIQDGREGAASIAMQLESGAGKLVTSTSNKKAIRTYAEAALGAIVQINDAFMGVKPPGVSSGLPQLDKTLGFFRPGQMILLGGRPSMGKTTVAQNFAYHAMTHGTGVYYASLEMVGEELSPRFFAKGLAQRGINIPYDRMLRGDLTDIEMRKVYDEAKIQSQLPLFIGERDVRDTGRLRSSIRRAKQSLEDTDTPLGLVVVDYVQQISSTTARSTYDRASEASDMCKSVAMEFGVPVVALAQLSRDVERREPPVPMLADLRETGKLEEDADVVMFCYRESYYLQRKLDGLPGNDYEGQAEMRLALQGCENSIDLIISKQRSGRTGTVQAYVDLGTCHVTADRSGDEGRLI